VQLRIAASDDRRVLALNVSAPGVQVWRTSAGHLIAHGYRQGTACWMHWPALAAFHFADGDPFITAFTEPGVTRAAVEDVYRRGVLPMAIQALGREALHASGVLAASGVIAVAARSHTGKSTFAYAFSRRGFPQWADDGVVLQMERGSVTSVPLPFQVRLRPESSQLFGFSDAGFRQFTPDVIVAGDDPRAVPVAAICLLRRLDSASAGSPPAVVTRLHPADAFTEVLIHAHEFNPFDVSRRRRMLEAYLQAVAMLPVFDVQFMPGREQLDSVLDIVTEALGLTLPRRVQESVA
jgi:hypothetical protein